MHCVMWLYGLAEVGSLWRMHKLPEEETLPVLLGGGQTVFGDDDVLRYAEAHVCLRSG